MRFAGKVAVVTAAASGIGRAAAVAMAAEGASVVLADINAAAGQALADELAAQGRNAAFVKTDVRLEDDIVAMIATARARFGGVDYACNVAGGGPSGQTLTACTRETWDNGLALNLTSTWMCMKHQIPAMIARGGGAIVNVTSMAGLRVSARSSVFYGTAKAGLVHLTRIAAYHHARDNIRVNCVAPSLTGTVVQRIAPAELQALLRNNLIERVSDPEDIAATMLYLCSDEARMITGHTMPVDGGQHAK
ncbi:MAG: SDR family NAD(P)-dependent oxidoreductase [Gammaproteobacteria bacterium]